MSTIQEQQQIATKSENSDSSPQNTVLSPLAPSSASPTSLQNDEIQTSTSPVMLATMTPVSVDDFPVDYHQAAVVSQVDTAGVGQATDTLDNKQVIYVSTTNGGTHQAILYDPQNPDSLTQGLSMETINTSNGPVSVVIQQPNSLINHTNTSATTYQGPGGATVLVLQELVDDMSSSSATAATVGIKSKRSIVVRDDFALFYQFGREVGGGGDGGGGGNMAELQAGAAGGVIEGNGSCENATADNGNNGPGSDSNGGAANDAGAWRSYYEHPLTAATSAMLNISGASTAGTTDSQSAGLPVSCSGFVYEYYKLPQLTTVIGSNNDKIVTSADMNCWPSSTGSTGICSTSTAAALLTGSLKASNGTNSTGLEIGANQLSDLGIFLPHTVASSIKREPEDLSHPQQHRTNPQTGKSSLDQKLSQGRTKVVLVAPGSSSSEIVVDVINGNGDPSPPIKEEYLHSPVGNGNNRSSINGNSASSGGTTSGPLELIATPDGLKPAATAMYSAHVFATQAHPGSGGGGGGGGAGGGSPSPNAYAEHTSQAYVPNSPLAGYITTSTATGRTSAFTDPYYREYFGTDPQSPYGNAQVRQLTTAYADNSATGADNGVVGNSFVERYARQNIYHNSKSVIATPGGLTVDLPSPDSGIGTDTITPRDQAAMQQSFEYEMCQTPLLSEPSATGRTSVGPAGHSPAVATGAPSRSRPWHDFGRQNDADKIQIPKVYSQYGFRFHLETAISTNQRREDDRVTYINKGQFYGITMEYLNDPEKPLKAQTVKSVVMLLFREEKSPEDEIKAWHFWHGRQHSVKQRILDADTKNSAGLVTGIEEVAHNAIAVYWNPLESSAKINIAVQCLSTDFSSQKGVKGLPLHIQIDTYDDPRGEGPVIHRAYCQIKVFCDKGAERKTRDEERRAAKRRLTATGRKKMDELYHTPCERSEFYSMADLTKPPVLFAPAEDIDKLTSMELQTFYHDADASSLSNGETGSLKHTSPFLIHPGTKVNAPPPALKFHNHFPPDSHGEKKDNSLDASLTTDGTVFSSPPPLKRSKMIPPLNERVMLYVRQENEDVYTPLHVAPPTTQGLLNAIQSKYKITSSSISNLYRKNKQGITAKLDDDMLKYYCNEDIFLLEVTHSKDEFLDIYLIELQDH